MPLVRLLFFLPALVHLDLLLDQLSVGNLSLLLGHLHQGDQVRSERSQVTQRGHERLGTRVLIEGNRTAKQLALHHSGAKIFV